MRTFARFGARGREIIKLPAYAAANIASRQASGNVAGTIGLNGAGKAAAADGVRLFAARRGVA